MLVWRLSKRLIHEVVFSEFALNKVHKSRLLYRKNIFQGKDEKSPFLVPIFSRPGNWGPQFEVTISEIVEMTILSTREKEVAYHTKIRESLCIASKISFKNHWQSKLPLLEKK